MHVANIRTFYVTARVRLHLYVESFVFSVANSPPLHAFSLTAFTVTVALVRKARNEFGRNFWHSFKSTNYHCITNIQETPDLSRQFLANYVFYRIEFSFIQIMNSFFRAARKREKCARIYLRRTAQITTVCAKCVPCVALGVTTGKREYQILEIQIFL